MSMTSVPRNKLFHEPNDYCIGCPTCADANCPACKGTGRVRHGAESWSCGCTYLAPNSPACAERVARDVAKITRVPHLYRHSISARYHAPDSVCSSAGRCLRSRGDCEAA